ncbi:hypothetical protein [Gordonia zhaorongruii]|uniref:hypothetical protein n=1 Tax=Gordonia zhaorongruii TaxID=2597659 RepID=UPI001052A254|nr:hypothetical protein [Gordonia zhaorongruii]
MTTDERRAAIRDAALHVCATFAAGLVVLIVALNTDGGVHTAFLIAGPVVIVIGTIAAMVRTWLIWRRNGDWQMWQGASWFLLGLSVTWVFGAIPALIT